MVRVMVVLPEGLLSEINEASKELRTNRSQLFRQAIIKYLNELRQKEFENLMAEGYQEMAAEDLADAKGFLGTMPFILEE